jgi:hypothetical protein
MKYGPGHYTPVRYDLLHIVFVHIGLLACYLGHMLLCLHDICLHVICLHIVFLFVFLCLHIILFALLFFVFLCLHIILLTL